MLVPVKHEPQAMPVLLTLVGEVSQRLCLMRNLIRLPLADGRPRYDSTAALPLTLR